ncbi:MAG: adenylosuccinate lyase [Saprospiraceae bacterium]|nr:adenylosuccinate lyase [Saprospiraceae bacterium]
MLKAISPIDGRYSSQSSALAAYFSEYALIQYRVLVEVEYFIALIELPLPQLSHFDPDKKEMLRSIYSDFTLEDAEKIKSIEKVTNHDVKAVEYFIKEKLDDMQLDTFKEFIHFGLTSQDINNTAIPISIKEALDSVYFPAVEQLILTLYDLADQWKEIPMLARTHGQPASPTGLGKEIRVYADRLETQLISVKSVPIHGKFGGATGNFNAHIAAYPHIDWVSFANNFLGNILGIIRTQTTTQIEHYDQLAALFHAMSRINTILLDFCRDIWTYVSMEYFKQKVVKGEIGSSAMPHKVNPIDFENAEGNLGIANAFLGHLAEKLPVSRLQRDLTDSTVLRNVGMPFGYGMIALKSIIKGINKLELNENKIQSDLDQNWIILAEGIQSILRREGFDQPYELLKELTRGNSTVNQEVLHSFIDKLEVSEEIRIELKKLQPSNYTGNAMD